MISRRSRSHSRAVEGQILARFRPIAPKPAACSTSPPCSLPVKRSKSSPVACNAAASAAGSPPLKKLKSLPLAASSCSSLRPLIPVAKPGSSCWQEQDRRCHLQTLTLLPLDGSVAPPSPHDSDSSPHSSDSSEVIDPPDTELSLGSSSSQALPSRSLAVDSSSFSPPAIPKHLDALPLPMAAMEVTSGRIVWNNAAFLAASDVDLRHPVPLLTLAVAPSTAVLWMFLPASSSKFLPMKPQAVRASIAGNALEPLSLRSHSSSLLVSSTNA